MEFGKAIKYGILIEPTDNKGFIVKVGCGTFAFSNKEDLKEAFNGYMDDPEGFEKKYNETTHGDVTENAREEIRETGMTSEGPRTESAVRENPTRGPENVTGRTDRGYLT